MRATVFIILSTIFISVSALFVTTERIIGVPIYDSFSTHNGTQQYLESSSYDILADAIVGRINITYTGSFHNTPSPRTASPSTVITYQTDYRSTAHGIYSYGANRAVHCRKYQVNYYIYALHKIRI